MSMHILRRRGDIATQGKEGKIIHRMEVKSKGRIVDKDKGTKEKSAKKERQAEVKQPMPKPSKTSMK